MSLIKINNTNITLSSGIKTPPACDILTPQITNLDGSYEPYFGDLTSGSYIKQPDISPLGNPTYKWVHYKNGVEVPENNAMILHMKDYNTPQTYDERDINGNIIGSVTGTMFWVFESAIDGGGWAKKLANSYTECPRGFYNLYTPNYRISFV